MTELEKARKTINEVDLEMAKLFEKRMDAATKVAEYKMETGMQVYDAAREDDLVRRNAGYINNIEYKSYYINFIRNCMDISKNYQRRIIEGMKVAFSGVEGAFANIAAEKIFPGSVYVAYPDFKSAYDAVVDGECNCAVLPIENSYNGDVGQVMDLAFFGSLFINGIYDVSVVQNLLGVPGASIEDIKTVISHPQALGQCAEYIKKHGFEEVQAVNTAIAAKQVAEMNKKEIAAIASDEAAEKYGLKKLESHINEADNNTTRFAVFSRVPKAPSTKDNQFFMVFTVSNEAGALGRAISIIGKYNFNLRSLKSRPTKDLIWSYYFTAEGEGNIHTEKGREMLCELSNCCRDIKVLGSFENEISL